MATSVKPRFETASMNFPEILSHTATLACKIKASGFQPDFLVGLARGGWIPTRLLSDALSVREILSIGMRYTDASRTSLVAYSLPAPMPTGKRLLLIEDCRESGRSLLEARRILESAGNQVRTACLFITDGTPLEPDYFLARLPAPPRFPWE
jgi:hypoxanthine phosphoribosyltransferase